MARTAGATAAGTTQRLLRAAADVFAARGYDGTRVADIAVSAGLSNGALYAYFGSKAELLVAGLRARGRGLPPDRGGAGPARSTPALLLAPGRGWRRRRAADGWLVIGALVAARRDEDVAGPMR